MRLIDKGAAGVTAFTHVIDSRSRVDSPSNRTSSYRANKSPVLNGFAEFH